MNKRTEHELPSSVVRVVAALCGDYERMKKELKKENDERLRLTYFTYTYTIYDEVAKATRLVGCHVDTMIAEIGTNTGYLKSELVGILSRGQYYRFKQKAIYRIAKALFLY